MHGTGQPHADADDLVAGDLGLLERVGEQGSGERDRLLCRQIRIERAVALGQQRVREIGDREPHVALAEVDSDDDTGTAMQRDQDRRAAQRAAFGRVHGLGRLDDQARRMQFADDGRDRRRGKRSAAREVGARYCADFGQHPDDTRPGVATGRPFHLFERYTPIASSANPSFVRCRI